MSGQLRPGGHALVAVPGPYAGTEVITLFVYSIPCPGCGESIWLCVGANAPLKSPLWTQAASMEVTGRPDALGFHAKHLIPLDPGANGVDDGEPVDKPVDREVTA